jgi:hypothetical protein
MAAFVRAMERKLENPFMIQGNKLSLFASTVRYSTSTESGDN